MVGAPFVLCRTDHARGRHRYRLPVLVTRDLVSRLEAVEAVTAARLVRALAETVAVPPVPAAEPFGAGVLVATGASRYVNRAVGLGLDELGDEDVGRLVAWFSERGLPAAVQLSSWAPPATVAALGAAGFVPASCRSVLVVDPVAVPVGVPDPALVVVPVTDDATARAAADVMAGGAAEHRTASDEFMAADRVSEGTTQLLALLDGEPVGCGSLTVVGRTGWVGAAATVERARRRGVQAELLRHRARLALAAGCDLVGVTATTGSASARNLQRLGFELVHEQWVVQRPVG